MELYDLVKRLVGDIKPIGESDIDSIRLTNLKEMTTLVEKLVYDIVRVSHNKTRIEFSVQTAGEHAHRFLEDLKGSLDDDVY